MNPATPRSDPPPAPKFALKPREFTSVNAAPGTEAPSAEHDVFEILKSVRVHEAAAGVGEVGLESSRKSRRRRDFLLLLIGGNSLMLGIFLVELFLGFQVMCLAADMTEQFPNLVRYALGEGRPMFTLPAICMTCYSTALWWLMFGAGQDY